MGGGERARDDDAAGGHRGHADALALELREALDRAVVRHGDAVDVALIGGIEALRLDTLLPADCERVERRQAVWRVAAGDRLHAVG